MQNIQRGYLWSLSRELRKLVFSQSSAVYPSPCASQVVDAIQLYSQLLFAGHFLTTKNQPRSVGVEEVARFWKYTEITHFLEHPVDKPYNSQVCDFDQKRFYGFNMKLAISCAVYIAFSCLEEMPLPVLFLDRQKDGRTECRVVCVEVTIQRKKQRGTDGSKIFREIKKFLTSKKKTLT